MTSETPRAGDAPAPPRPTDAADDPSAMDSAATAEATRRPDARIAARDPRSKVRLSLRDVRALAFIALMGACAQYQLALAIFFGLSEVVVSRCVRRLFRLGLIDLLRWNGRGVNLLRVRAAGRDVLLESGVEEQRIFQVRWPTTSTLPHRLWIIDVYLALQRIGWSQIRTCWMLRRAFAGEKRPVPDLLVRSPDRKRLLAVEVDRGTESVRDIVAPRQAALETSLAALADHATPHVLFLTSGPRRAESLRSHLASSSVAVALLPKAIGRPAVEVLASMLSGAVQSSGKASSQDATT